MKVASRFSDAETHMPDGEEKLGVGSNQGKRLKASEVPPNAHCFIKVGKLDSHESLGKSVENQTPFAGGRSVYACDYSRELSACLKCE